MNYATLDNEELLHLALEAMNRQRDADAVVMLKNLLGRDPGNVYGQYLLAAQHAQMGLLERAEEGLREVVAVSPGLAAARFQLGQLLIQKGAATEADQALAPLISRDDSLGAYARALIAIGQDNRAEAMAELIGGLAFPQEIPALTADMQRLLDLLQQDATEEGAVSTDGSSTLASAPIFLTGYSRGV